MYDLEKKGGHEHVAVNAKARLNKDACDPIIRSRERVAVSRSFGSFYAFVKRTAFPFSTVAPSTAALTGVT